MRSELAILSQKECLRMSIMQPFRFSKFRFLFSFVTILLAVTAIGWLFTGYLVDLARRTAINNGKNASLIVSLHLTNELKRIEGAVEAMAGSPLILPALLSLSPSNTEKANSALDRYQSALGASVCYLMDITGLTIASSNRNTRESFVGQSYDFRAYFEQALGGGKGLQFALGVTSGERGFYASFPVRTADGRVVGVVAMKKNLGDLEKELTQYPWCLVDRNGIIFISSKPEMRLKSLHPLDSETVSRLILSREFGPGPFEPILQEEMEDGSEVVLGGSQYLVTRHFTEYDGWSVILFWPAKQIGTYRLFGITLTLLTGLLSISFLTVIYVFKQSAGKIRKREATIRAVLDATRDSIFLVDTNETVLAVNETGTERISKTAGDVIGHNLFDFVPPSLVASRRERLHEVIRSGRGVRFEDRGHDKWIDNSLYPVFDEEGNVIQIAIYARDITERKQAEEERERLILELRDALARIRTLSGLLPICASCKKIRNDEGYWEQLEVYIRDRSEAEFSHGLCPECARRLYPELYDK